MVLVEIDKLAELIRSFHSALESLIAVGSYSFVGALTTRERLEQTHDENVVEHSGPVNQVSSVRELSCLRCKYILWCRVCVWTKA